MTLNTWTFYKMTSIMLVKKLNKVLSKLKSADFKVNEEKSFFVSDELEYLGFKITREGIIPLPDPATKKQLRSFIELINQFREKSKHRSGILTTE